MATSVAWVTSMEWGSQSRNMSSRMSVGDWARAVKPVTSRPIRSGQARASRFIVSSFAGFEIGSPRTMRPVP